MSKIQCGGFDFDDSSFEMKTVNGQKVLGNKYGGVVTYKIESENDIPVIYVSLDELVEQLENGNFIVFLIANNLIYGCSFLTSLNVERKHLNVRSVSVTFETIDTVFVYDEEYKCFVKNDA